MCPILCPETFVVSYFNAVITIWSISQSNLKVCEHIWIDLKRFLSVIYLRNSVTIYRIPLEEELLWIMDLYFNMHILSSPDVN